MTDHRNPTWLRPCVLIVLLIMYPIGLVAAATPDDEIAAAERGDPEALFVLAERFETGDGIEQDLTTATLLYRHAAERGHPLAQYRLGLALAFGIGVAKDLPEGRYWLLTSDRQSDLTDPLVKPILDRIDQTISAEDKAKTEAEEEAFRPKEGPVALTILSEPPERIEEASPPPDTDPALLLAERLGERTCGRIRTNVDEGGVTTIGAEVVDTATIPGAITNDLGDDVELRLVDVAPSICTALRSLVRSGPTDAELELRNHEGEFAEVFHDGDHIVIDIPPAPEPRHLTIDYYVHDGVVLHLLPNAEQPDNFLEEGQGMTLGELGGGGQVWQVSPPFGNDLIVMHTSSKPLPTRGRPAIESADDYLDALEPLLDDGPDGADVRTTYRIVRTSP